MVTIIRAVQGITIAGYAFSAYEKPLEFFNGNYSFDAHDYRDIGLEGGFVAIHILIGLAFTNCVHSMCLIFYYIDSLT